MPTGRSNAKGSLITSFIQLLRPTSAAPLPTLPIEIIYHIIDYLPWRDASRTLQSTSLVCRSLRDVSQRRMFETINITTHYLSIPIMPYLAKHIQDMRDLAMSPRLVSYARNIKITLPNPISEWIRWVAECGNSLVVILETVQSQKIKRFELSGGDFLWQNPTGGLYDDTVERLRRKIMATCDSPSLVELHIHYASYTLLHKCKAPSLKTVITMSSSPTDTSLLLDSPRRATVLRLERLKFTGYSTTTSPEKTGIYNYLLDPRNLIDLESLKDLTFSLTGQPGLFVELNKLLNSCYLGLQTLSLERCLGAAPIASTPNFPALANLRSLRLWLDYEENPHRKYGFMNFFTQQITNNNFPPKLQHLAIYPTYASAQSPGVYEIWNYRWEALEEALIDLDSGQLRIPDLKTVAIYPRIRLPDNAIKNTEKLLNRLFKRISGEVKASMSRLDKAGILEC